MARARGQHEAAYPEQHRAQCERCGASLLPGVNHDECICSICGGMRPVYQAGVLLMEVCRGHNGTR
mgnify:FL=1